MEERRWNVAPNLVGLLALAALVVALWRALAPPVLAVESARPEPTPVSQAALLGPLPGMERSPTVALASRVATQPSATAEALPTDPSPSATASPVPSTTPLPAPTATATPIHAPADSAPSRITIPSLKVDAAVITVGVVHREENGEAIAEWEVADFSAGFHEGTAWPGHVGNTVIAGHNNIRGKVFQDLYKINPGDDIYVWAGQGPFRYQVDVVYRLPIATAPLSVQEQNVRWILPTGDQRLTLVTCWPPWGNSHRIIVVAYPAPWDDSAQPELS